MEDVREKMTVEIARHLDTLYPDYSFCTMEEQSGVMPPRFLLSCLSADLSPRITTAGRFVTFSFELLFDPGEDHPELLNDVYLPVLLALEEIPAGEHLLRPVIGTLRARKNTAEGVLQFYFDLMTALHDPVEERDKIRQLSIHTEVEENR